MATPAPPISQTTAEELWHLSLNEDKQSTIVFIHGGAACHLEFSLVAPHLPEYHLLLVDLPGHSSSSHIQPFSLPLAVNLIATLIRIHAHSKVARVVATSAGGAVALKLAQQHPELVASLFISGFTVPQGWRTLIVTYPMLAYMVMVLPMTLMPVWLFKALWSQLEMPVSTEFVQAQQSNMTLALMRDIWGAVSAVTMEEVRNVNVRALAVMGGKHDDVIGGKEMGIALKTQCEDSKAVVIKGASHLWNLQWPRLFADCVKAWVEGGALPKECEEL